MLSRLLSALLLLFALRAPAATISKGFDQFYNLDYDAAIAEFKKQISADPENPAGYDNLAMAVLYRDMFRFGALESEMVSGTNAFLRQPKMNPTPADQAEFEGAIGKAMALSQARVDKNPKDALALYTLGVAYGLRANYSFLVRKAWMDALRDVTSSRKLHHKALDLDPSMVDARMLEGVHDYIVGSLPWHLKLLGFLAGFRGDREEGIRTVEDVAAHGDRNRVDAEILLCVVYRRERRPQKAVPLLQSLIARFPRNYLLRFEIAQMYADLGDKKNALAAVQRIEDLKAAGYAGYDRVVPEKICYARGTIQFWYNDLDQALVNMKRVTARSQDLGLNTSTFAWLRVGQIYDLTGQRALAVQAYQQSVRLAPDSDAAKLSREYLSAPYRRPRRAA